MKQQFLTFPRIFTKPHHDPFDTVTWETRHIVQKNQATGEVLYDDHVLAPTTWSDSAVTIAATKYFCGNFSDGTRENSIKSLIKRVVDVYVEEGIKSKYFNHSSAKVFRDELTYILLHQYAAFNSPVWFNVGVEEKPAVSACFILGIEDSMESILDWYKTEGLIFKNGSGAGVNLSPIRGSKEELSKGGTASGPVSFMRGADASAGTIKSGGKTRRAAKLIALDVDHPDVKDFINTKRLEERKIKALAEAGFDMSFNGKDITSVQYQNANNSVRLTDGFMQAYADDTTFTTRARTSQETWETPARPIMRSIAEAIWECGDPGVQFSDTINARHTIPAAGPINASNPCSEYMSIDNSSCNLASINLAKFVEYVSIPHNTPRFLHRIFRHVCEILITAMDISIEFGHFPTDEITSNTKRYRQLGLGYTNLGALLMELGLAYDSDDARLTTSGITALMNTYAIMQSQKIAEYRGSFDGLTETKGNLSNTEATATQYHTQLQEAQRLFQTFADLHSGSHLDLFFHNAFDTRAVEKALNTYHFRNSQVTLLAPTGTIAFLMDCQTTGIEPEFSLVKYKTLVGGSVMKIVNNTVKQALHHLGYSAEHIKEIEQFIADNNTVVNAPHLDPQHYAVFDCAMGKRAISPLAHCQMMAAAQPFLSGAISKTVNIPQDTTVEEIEQLIVTAHQLKLKALAIYRDGCKNSQPLTTQEKKKEAQPMDNTSVPVVQEPVQQPVKPRRERLPRARNSVTTSFSVGGAEGYLTAGEYDDGRLGEIFLKFGKQGSTLAGMMDAFSIAISIALQHGVPLETLVQKYTNMKFEPAGMTDDSDVRMAQSIMDYVFKKLALRYLPRDVRSELGIYTNDERTRYVNTGSYFDDDDPQAEPQAQRGDVVEERRIMQGGLGDLKTKEETIKPAITANFNHDAPLCMTCGTTMRRSGSCHVCEHCGTTSGCS